MNSIRPLPIEIEPWAVYGYGADSKQWIYRFANGYGASVINDGYDADRGLYELAVVVFDGDSYIWAEDTPVANDVLGWLSVSDVAEILVRIAALPANR